MFTRPKEIAPLQIARAMAPKLPGPERFRQTSKRACVGVSPRGRRRLGSMSSRRPLNEGARSVPARVHSRNSTRATSAGSTNTVPFGGWRPSKGESSRRRGSRRRIRSDSVEAVKPAAHLARIDQTALVERAHRQRAEARGAAALPARVAAHHHVLGAVVLHLDPGRGATSRFVGGVQALGHDPLEILVTAGLQQRLAVTLTVGRGAPAGPRQLQRSSSRRRSR